MSKWVKTVSSDVVGTPNTIRALNSQVVATDVGPVVNSVLHGLTTGGGGGYVDVKVNPSGALVVDSSFSITALVPASPSTGSVTSTSTQMVASNGSRRGLIITNLGAVNVFFGCGATAVTNNGIVLTPNGTWVMDVFTFYTGAINAVCASTATLSIQEYT